MRGASSPSTPATSSTNRPAFPTLKGMERDPDIAAARRVAASQEIRQATGIDEPMIDALVESFYARVRDDDLIGPVFATQITAAGGEILFSDPLRAPQPQSRFTPTDDGVLVTDGPFAETKEVVLGYYKIRIDSEQAARELAALCPTAGYVDLRLVGLER